MDWLKLPPLASLRAFAALAETGSATRAGAALNVTHAAISQQVRSLEASLGTKLVVRAGRGIRLTAAGMRLAGDLTNGFATIEGGIAALRDAESNRPVQVTLSPAFAVAWLMPRLPDFRMRHPDITLLLNPTAEVIEITPGGMDVAMRYRERNRPPPLEELMPLDLLIVGAPRLLGPSPPKDPADWTALPWLQELGTNEVGDWFARRKIKPDRPLAITHMPGNLIMEAVRRGDGLTFTPRPLVEAGIRSGELIELFCEPEFGGIYLETQPDPLRQPVREFVAWLRRQAA